MLTGYSHCVKLSVVLITLNEEANIGLTLQSIPPLISDGDGEVIIVDSGSTDRTVEIARSHGAKIFVEPWKGFAAQKNSAMDKTSGDWILQLDADEELELLLAEEITAVIKSPGDVAGFFIPRKNFFLGKWIRHGGFYPDPKLRLIRKGAGKFEEYGAHPTIKIVGKTATLKYALIHRAYPTLRGYIDHMNSYSSQGAQLVAANGPVRFSFSDVVARPLLTFFYNYFIRLGFLDGKEGLLLHIYHSIYVSWKYAKAWELSRNGANTPVS